MSRNLLFLLLRQIRVNHIQKCSFGILEKQEQTLVNPFVRPVLTKTYANLKTKLTLNLEIFEIG